jgi:hypothetical protein
MTETAKPTPHSHTETLTLFKRKLDHALSTLEADVAAVAREHYLLYEFAKALDPQLHQAALDPQLHQEDTHAAAMAAVQALRGLVVGPHDHQLDSRIARLTATLGSLADGYARLTAAHRALTRGHARVVKEHARHARALARVCAALDRALPHDAGSENKQ